jgi:carboxyl-terminal processing protease
MVLNKSSISVILSIMKRTEFSLSFLAWLLLAIWQPSYAFSQSVVEALNPRTDSVINLRIFDQAWSKIDTHFFDPKFNEVDWAKMKYIYRPQAEQAKNREDLLRVIRKMMAELKTSHLEIWAKPMINNKEFRKEIEPKIGRHLKKGEVWTFGNGMKISAIEGQLLITRVFPGSPAERAGIKPGWILAALNDKPVSVGKPVIFEGGNVGRTDVYGFRDLKDTETTLSFPFEWFAVTPQPKIEGRMLEGNICHIMIDEFDYGIGNWVKQAMTNFRLAKGVIIDLRGNKGGFVKEVKRSLSPFFREDTEYGTHINRKGRAKETKVKGQGQKAFSGEVVVLADEFTISGGETFCAVIRENGRGKVVGMKTTGYVLSAHPPFHLSHGVQLLVPTLDYRTPKGVRLEGTGIVPDIVISPTIGDIRTGRDRALDKAIEVLSLQIR